MEKIRQITESCEQTEQFAEKFAKSLQGGTVLLLQGEMGAGKTHFVKGLARGLGVEEVVTSPTFTLHNAYMGTKMPLNHFDFYRVSSEEVEMLGLNEFFFDKNAICAIEWSENVVDLLPAHCVTVKISTLSENTREIEIEF